MEPDAGDVPQVVSSQAQDQRQQQQQHTLNSEDPFEGEIEYDEYGRATIAGREIEIAPEDDYDYGDDGGEVPVKKVPLGSIYEAARAGDVDRIKYLLEEEGVDVNARDRWDSVPLYYSCLAGRQYSAWWHML